MRNETDIRDTLNYLLKKYNLLGEGRSDNKKQLEQQIDFLRWTLQEVN